MANTNLDSTSMTNKVISLIVAIIVFACVLIPVLDAIGSGDSGGGDTAYTNTGDYYYTSTAGKTFTVEKIDHVDTNDIALSTELRTNGQTTYTWDWSDEYEYVIYPLGFDENILFEYFGSTYAWASGEESDAIYRPTSIDNAEDHTQTYIWTITDGIVTYIVNNESVTAPFQLDYILTNEPSEYVVADSPVTVEYDTPLLFGINYDDAVGGAYNVICGNITPAIGNNNVELSLTYPDDCSASVSFTVSDLGDAMRISDISLAYSERGGQYTIPAKPIVPTVVEISGSGSDSDSGIVGTLIGIIPIFVALALVIGVVSMFYNPNRMN